MLHTRFHDVQSSCGQDEAIRPSPLHYAGRSRLPTDGAAQEGTSDMQNEVSPGMNNTAERSFQIGTA